MDDERKQNMNRKCMNKCTITPLILILAPFPPPNYLYLSPLETHDSCVVGILSRLPSKRMLLLLLLFLLSLSWRLKWAKIVERSSPLDDFLPVRPTAAGPWQTVESASA